MKMAEIARFWELDKARSESGKGGQVRGNFPIQEGFQQLWQAPQGCFGSY